jgi:hypothetical protein
LLQAAVPPGAERVEFRVDGTLVGMATPPEPSVLWDLEVGRHVLEVTAVFSADGRLSASTTFEVRP